MNATESDRHGESAATMSSIVQHLHTIFAVPDHFRLGTKKNQEKCLRHGRVGQRLDQQDLSADFCQLEQLHDLLVVQSDAAVRRPPPDLARVVGPVDTVGGPGQVQRPHA